MTGALQLDRISGMKNTRKKNENIRALSDQDLYLFNEGNHLRLYDRMGAHPGKDGTRFAVWAPNAKSVHVIGDFNGWNRGSHPLAQRGSSGIWEGIIPGVKQGQNYKYFVASRYGDYSCEKADPFAFAAEVHFGTATDLYRPKTGK